MKILYFGTQNSGKSSLAELHTLKLSSKTPYYIATYDNSFDDMAMEEKINNHKKQRANKFIVIEEPKELLSIVKPNNTYIIDCISMWLFNNSDVCIEKILADIEELSKIEANIVFVLNDISGGLVPVDKDSREFVKRSGLLGQKLAQLCDEVYEVKYGLKSKLK